MAQEQIPIDISDEPAVIRLAEKACADGAALVLEVDGEAVAVLTPTRSRKQRGGQALTNGDALFRLIGIGSSGIPGGVSDHKHEALRRAKRSH